MNVLTEYTIKAECIEDHIAALKKFEEAVKAMKNSDFKFTAYQLQDKVSFRHVTYIKDDETAKLFMSQPLNPLDTVPLAAAIDLSSNLYEEGKKCQYIFTNIIRK